VDHGKTALIKALTNIDCDSHKEEKERGITINLGFAHINLPSGESVGIVDVPGHKDFIKTMVAGAFGIDIVLFCIAADSGIMPQTIEHLQILKLLGIENGIFVITKSDLVDAEMMELVQLEIVELIEGSPFESAPIVPVSSINGNGLNDLTSEISRLFPKINEKTSQKTFRMFIDRVFNVKGIGYITTGSVLGGKIQNGSNLYLLPGGSKQYKVRSLERHGIPVNEVTGGDRAAINLTGFKMSDYERGQVLTDTLLEETTMIDAIFNLFTSDDIGLWTKAIFYTGTFECAVKIHLLDMDQLAMDDTAIVQLHLEKPAILLNQDKFIIRNSSNDKTLGGGMIIDINPLHHRRRTPKLIDALNDLAEAALNSEQQFNIIKIELKKLKKPIFAEHLAEQLKIGMNDLIYECQNNNDGSIVLFSENMREILIYSEAHSDYIKVILDELVAYHQMNFLLEEGMEEGAFIGKLEFKTLDAGKNYLKHALSEMESQGLIKSVGKTWALQKHHVKIDDKTQQHIDWLEKAILRFDKQTPLNKELEAQAFQQKISKENLKLYLKYLVKLGKIHASEGEYIHSYIVDEVKRKLLPVLKEKERGINEKEFRLLFNSTKNFVKTMIRILVEEGLVTKSEFYIHITEKGKNYNQR
jgi:selenocysteine-specific elongation factor